MLPSQIRSTRRFNLFNSGLALSRKLSLAFAIFFCNFVTVVGGELIVELEAGGSVSRSL
jgi:hypothetical protein